MRHVIRLACAFVACLLAGAAVAQIPAYPRVGISASPDHYVDRVRVQSSDEIFTLYACIFGPESGGPLEQPVSQVAWVIHQACCGAEILVHDVQFSPEFTHTGHPLTGVQSVAAGCVDRQSILLATITASIVTNQAGDLLWAAGPFGPARDCEGEQPMFYSMAVTIDFDGVVTPESATSWGSLKSTYR